MARSPRLTFETLPMKIYARFFEWDFGRPISGRLAADFLADFLSSVFKGLDRQG